MKKILQILLFLFIPFSLTSQTITLQWSENRIIYIGEDSVEVMAFDGAHYDGTHMPYYHNSIEISDDEAASYEYNFSISDLVFTPINSEVSIDNNFLTDDFQVYGKMTTSRRVSFLDVTIIPFKLENKKLFRLESFKLNIEKHPIIKLKSATGWFANNSLLSTGKWCKVGVKKDGIYKLTYRQLQDMGIEPSQASFFTKTPGMESTIIQDYVDDIKEIPVYDGGDYILFYAQGPDTWNYNNTKDIFEHEQHLFSNENYYFISSDVGEAKRIKARTEPVGTSTKTYTTYVDYDFYEPEEYNIGQSGREWYSDEITSGNSITHTFNFDQVIQSTAKLNVRVLAQSYSSDNYLSISVDGQKKMDIILSAVESSGTTDLASYQSEIYSFVPVGNNVEVQLTYTSQENTAKAYVDYFAVELLRELTLENSHILFRNKSVSDNLVTYEISNANANTLIWDVSNAFDVRSVSSTLNGTKSSFLAVDNAAYEFVAVDLNSSFLSPDIYGSVENQNLHATAVPDMVILTDESLLSVAEDLADIHRKKDSLDIFIVTQHKIFNEFSGGKADVTAIRWFMKMLYDKSADTDKFKYLLILGDGSYNNRLYEKGSNVAVEPGLIMTYQSIESLYGSTSYISDDYFGLLDDDEGYPVITNATTKETYIDKFDKVDIGIGRIPINTVTEGNNVVNKIKTYLDNNKRTVWKNRICLVADDGDNNVHVDDADKLAEKLRRENPGMAIKKVYIDAFEEQSDYNGSSVPDAKKLSDKYMEEGTLIWSYTGHGSPVALSGEQMMRLTDIVALKNIDNLPIWLTATCDFTPYDHNNILSAGENVILNPSGGGIALFTTTRLVYSSSNYVISNNFYSHIMKSDANGDKLRLGDVVRLTKQATGTGANKRKFTLIGDPALHLNNVDALWEVKTDSINGQSVALFSDTIKALSQMTISGHIAKSDGSLDTDFTGLIYPIIYDKISEFTTLANEGGSQKKDFVMWNSVLYSGKTSVTKGRFTFSFLMPKNMDYSVGQGRIEYYATSEKAEANGYYEDFYIGGFNSDFEADNEGPKIDLYFNSKAFSDGDVVNPNSLLIAEISDSSGINTSDNFIGHTMTIMLDNDSKTLTDINSSYATNDDDFTRGTVAYRLNNLEEGTHTLQLKAWDMQNNSSTKEVTFQVKNDGRPEIASVYCYPVSSGETMRFIAVYEDSDKSLTVKLNVFDASGQVVYSNGDYSYSPSNEIYFDWKDLNLLHQGLYFYRITIDDGNGVSTSGTKYFELNN